MKLNGALEKEDAEPFGTILYKNIKFKNMHMRIHALFCKDRHLTPNKSTLLHVQYVKYNT